jgi:hypothetical protein
MKTYVHLWQYLAELGLYLEREVFVTKVGKKFKTHFMFTNFFPEKFAVYEIMLKSTEEANRLQVTM